MKKITRLSIEVLEKEMPALGEDILRTIIAGTNYDCVPWCLSYVAGSFGQSYSSNEFNTAICGWYSKQGLPYNGVFCGDFNTIMSTYFQGSSVTISGNYSIPSGTQTIIVVSGHAVVLLSVSDGLALYKDPQNGYSMRTVNVSNIERAYNCTGWAL
jgi:hypothetical protein